MMNQPPLPPAGGPPSPGVAPGAGPSAMGVPALNPLAARTAGAATQGMIPPALQATMLFLAGMGLPELARSLDRMKPKEAGHKGQLGKEAAANPQSTNALQAQMIAKLAAARGAGPAGPVPAGMPGAPAANPLAMFMGR